MTYKLETFNILNEPLAEKISMDALTEDGLVNIINLCDGKPQMTPTIIGEMILMDNIEEAYVVVEGLNERANESIYLNEISIKYLIDNFSKKLKEEGIYEDYMVNNCVAVVFELFLRAKNGWGIKKRMPEDGKIWLFQIMEKVNKEYF